MNTVAFLGHSFANWRAKIVNFFLKNQPQFEHIEVYKGNSFQSSSSYKIIFTPYMRKCLKNQIQRRAKSSRNVRKGSQAKTKPPKKRFDLDFDVKFNSLQERLNDEKLKSTAYLSYSFRFSFF